MISAGVQQKAIHDYLGAIESTRRQGNATEHSYRPAVKALLDSFAPHAQVTNEPKRIKCGAPDFGVARQFGGEWLNIAYLEAKDVGVNLAEIEGSDQLQRYRGALPNLILTDQLEFRLYVTGELRQTVRVGHFNAHGKLEAEPGGSEALAALLDQCLSASPAPITTARDLAGRLARLAHLIRDVLIEAFKHEAVTPLIADLRSALAETLLPHFRDPKHTPDFADMFAQLLTYALFAARANHPNGQAFTRQSAAAGIPKTNPFLRQLFPMITGVDLDQEAFAGFVDDLVALLNYADMDKILAEFGRREGFDDPIVHFYETFLTAYNPQLREVRGVYYTPQPVISYLTRSVDRLLRDQFGCKDGLADRSMLSTTSSLPTRTSPPGPLSEFREGEGVGGLDKPMHRVQILDPSTGTGAFLYQIVDLIRERYRARGDGGLWPGYVRDHLLPRLFGFELLVAPYAVAHLKLGMQLAALDLPADERPTWAYDFKANERLNVYLTNTLDEAEREVMTLWGPLRVIAEEAKTASKIKRDMPIMVILGNPPYSGHSANEGKWINDLLHGDLPGQPGYFEVDGKPLRERNPKWLNDDYVKFIRFAQWRIEHTGQGILAFITNHGYLENPTFRGMRQQLMRTFDEIYVLDLHGNARRRERAPDGSPDENVFDIQQGVAIGMFVKRPRSPDPAPVGWERGDSTAAIDPLSPVERGKGPGIEGGRVHHAELYGAREAKYEWLRGHDIGNTAWQTVNPVTPQYLFVPRAADAQAEYNAGWSIPDIFPVNSVGIVTGQDKKTIAFSRNDAIQLAHGHQLSEKTVVPILYRPFDERYIVYDNSVVTRSRRDVMQHMLAGQNIGLVCTRQQSQQSEWALVGIADKIIEGCYISNKTREINYLLPLYLYPEAGRLMDAPQYPPGKGGRVPNLAPKFVAELAACVGLTFVSDGRGDLQTTFGPEDALHYLYAALHSPEYRERFAPFLKTDFPRVALPTDGSEFVRLRGIGAKLVALHLLDPALDWSGAARFPVKGDNRVERGYPQYKDERVYLNAAQYFAGVAETVWNFQVGGYQVADKWLKDRRGRELTGDELEQYGQIVAALAETARLMGEV